MQPILEIHHISKSFKLLHEVQPYLSLRDSLVSFFKRGGTVSEDFLALDDVSFDVKPGESIGIIGKNGAGKSTLLKILSKITPPSSGKITVRGRIASLLEVGTGFHPELSGRENVYLNGAILGMKRKEIDDKFDAIIDFSGTEQFLDTPLKHYSSGMQLRLAFAVAAFLEPEILIIDEVLAVGDAEFQKKCIGKMEDVSKSGRTVLFVSHNLNAVNSLCSRCVYLKKGKVADIGPTSAVLDKYLIAEAGITSQRVYQEHERPGDDIASLISIRMVDKAGRTLDSAYIEQEVGVEMIYEIKKPGYQPIPNFHVFTIKGETAFFGIEKSAAFIDRVGIYTSTMWIPANSFNTGKYLFGPALSNLNPLIIHFFEREALVMDFIEDTNKRNTVFKDPIPGVLRPGVQWHTTKTN